MNKKMIIFVIIVIIMLIIGAVLINLKPVIKLNGENQKTISLLEDYEEEGAFVTYFGVKINKRINIIGEVDNKKIGKYDVIYSIKYLNKEIKTKRTIEVVDKIKPVITLKGKDTIILCPNYKYKEEGYSATDNYDGDITNKVERKEEKDKITYTVSDTSNNEDSKIRNLKYEDNEKPKIKLKGSLNAYVYLNESYKDPGYSISDNCDKNLKVKINSNVDTRKKGTYRIIYSVTDSNNNKAEATRKITVINKENIKGRTPIYLTFDDGPSSTITPGVLKILKEENVKATFFVINHSDKLNYLIKQAYDEGHTIAIHSYTHEYKKIYASESNYFNDLNKMSDKIYSIIKIRPKIIRFPGGSSNSVSKFNKGIMTTLTKKVEEQGYTYFDWNVESGDASHKTTKNDVYNNVIKGLSNKNNVVLMHDFENNYKTLEVLRSIIHYGKEQGYIFLPITDSTIPIHHTVNN